MYKNSCSAFSAMIVLAVLLGSGGRHASAESRQWSGAVHFERNSGSKSDHKSTWAHATAKGTPTSKTRTEINDSVSADFVLSPGGEASATVSYNQSVTQETTSDATILCRQPGESRYIAINRVVKETIKTEGGGRADRATVSVSLKKSGDYTVSVSTSEIPATRTFTTTKTGGAECGEQGPSSSEEPTMPPASITVPGISGQGRGKVDPNNPDMLAGSIPLPGGGKLSWNLKAKPEKDVQAVHGPYSVVRAQVVTFDGSRSKGRNLKYEWTLKPESCSGEAPGDEVKFQGPVVKATLLCDTAATLEVSDEDKKDKKTVVVKVKERKWKTPVTHKENRYFDNEGIAMSSEFHTVQIFAGANRCASHQEMSEGTGHYLHPSARLGTKGWEGVAYTLKQVNDGGPFNGYFYVDLGPTKLEVPRVGWLNVDLQNSSIMGRKNAESSNTNRDFMTLGAQVKAHERMHTTLLEEAVRQNDPLMSIEPLVRTSREELSDKAAKTLDDEEIRLASATVAEATVKARVKKQYPQFDRGGMICVPIGSTREKTPAGSGVCKDMVISEKQAAMPGAEPLIQEFGEWRIPNFADLGDE